MSNSAPNKSVVSDFVWISYKHSICPKTSLPSVSSSSEEAEEPFPVVAKIMMRTINKMTPTAMEAPIIIFFLFSWILSVFNPPISEFNSSALIGLPSSIFYKIKNKYNLFYY